MSSDPGIGNRRAPIGSPEWAKYVRLASQPVVRKAVENPRAAKEFVDLIVNHRAWTMLNRADGSTFASFDEFCEAPEPYGWGVPRTKLERLIADALADVSPGVNVEKTIALGTVAPATPEAERSPGRPKKGAKETTETVSDDSSHSPADAREAEKLRAINRAPEPIRDLFRQDLIGKGAAVALGTTARDTSPEKAAEVAAVTASVVAFVETKNPTTAAQKRKCAREVNAIVRERLGKRDPEDARIDRVVGALRGLSRAQLLRIRDEINSLLERAA